MMDVKRLIYYSYSLLIRKCIHLFMSLMILIESIMMGGHTLSRNERLISLPHKKYKNYSR